MVEKTKWKRFFLRAHMCFIITCNVQGDYLPGKASVGQQLGV